MDSFSITRAGKPLDESLYTIDIDNRVFASKEGGLFLDFGRLNEWTFKTGRRCTFRTGNNCTFKTAWGCSFDTLDECNFRTQGQCDFDTSAGCNFDTGGGCTFKTGSCCAFRTCSDCTFEIAGACSFLLYDINSCKFKTHDKTSTILDLKGYKHYLLTKELIDMLRLKNG